MSKRVDIMPVRAFVVAAMLAAACMLPGVAFGAQDKVAVGDETNAAKATQVQTASKGKVPATEKQTVQGSAATGGANDAGGSAGAVQGAQQEPARGNDGGTVAETASLTVKPAQSGAPEGTAASNTVAAGSTKRADTASAKDSASASRQKSGGKASQGISADNAKAKAVANEASPKDAKQGRGTASNKASQTAKGASDARSVGSQSKKDTTAGTVESQAKRKAQVLVRGRVQNDGTQAWAKAGVGSSKTAFVGTSGKGLQLQALWMKLGSALAGSIQYQVHMAGFGWQTLRSDGTMAGTTANGHQIEALRIALVGDVSKRYNIVYRSHVQDQGWQAWKSNGALSGTTGKGLRLEGLEIYLKKKAKIADDQAAGIVGLVYNGRVQNGKMGPGLENGQMAGTTGQSIRLEQIKLSLNQGSYDGNLKFRAHVQNFGWDAKWSQSGDTVGTTSNALRLEALRIKLTGAISKAYDVQYRAHVQNQGWQPWVYNGGVAGTTGKALQIEALQVRMVKKGAKASVADGTYVMTLGSNANRELFARGSAMRTRDFNKAEQTAKVYVRNERGGITIQSVSNGGFLTDSGSTALASWMKKPARQVWQLTRNGGLVLTNKKTKMVLGLKRGAAATGNKGATFVFTPTYLLNDGTFYFHNAAHDCVLDVVNASWDSGANVAVAGKNGGGNQVFTLTRKGGNWYTIANVMTGMSLDVADGSKSEGANIRQWTTNGSVAQQWKPGIERDGKLYFVNRASGKAITATHGGVATANVASYTYKAAATQKFTLEAGSWSFTGNAELDKYVLKIAKQNGNDLRRCFNWMGTLRHVQAVDGRTQRGIVSDSVLNSYAIHAARENKADCYVDAALFCWLARACGEKANMRAGGCPSASGGTVPHGWTEIYRGGATYVCDPNLNRDLPSYNWYMITYSSSPVTYALW